MPYALQLYQRSLPMPKEITVSKPWLATRDTGTRIRVSVWYMVFSSQEWLEFSLASNSSQGSFQFCCWDKCSSGRQVWSRKTAQPFIHTYDTKQAQSRLQGVELRSGLLFVFLRGMDGLDLRTYYTCTVGGEGFAGWSRSCYVVGGQSKPCNGDWESLVSDQDPPHSVIYTTLPTLGS